MFKEDYKAAFSRVTASEETFARIMKGSSQKKTGTASGAIGKILIAAAAIAALTVTASAAENGWFRQYFEKQNKAPLSQEEAAYIEKNEQRLGGQSQTHDGYTLTLKSAITDGKTAYVTIGITAPEGVVLSRTDIPGYDPKPPAFCADEWSFEPVWGDSFGGSWGLSSEEDYDGQDNTQNLLLTAELGAWDQAKTPFAPGRTWKLKLENLSAMYFNNAYWEELQKKLSSQTAVHHTQAEFDKLTPEVPLAEGRWTFRITFEESDFRTVELIQEPVTTSVIVEQPEPHYEDLKITSFTLGTLSAAATVDSEWNIEFEDFMNEKDICVVMKDGGRIKLKCASSSPGNEGFKPEKPIMLDQVDYVLLLDGTKLPMP